MTNSEENTSLADKDGLWGLLLGRKLDRVPPSERTLETLLRTFTENKKDLIRFYYDSTELFNRKIIDGDSDEAEENLIFLWADFEWRNKRTGEKFILEGELEEELERLESEGNVVRRLESGFALVWSAKDVRRPLIESDEVQSKVQTEAKPIFIRKHDEDTVEVRGSSRLLNSFTEILSESDNAESIEPEPIDEPILENLSRFFDAQISSLTLVEAEFNSTKLPGGSSLSLANSDGVHTDLNDPLLRPDIINKDNLSDLDQLKFVHEKIGIKIRVIVEQNKKGFYFKIDDSNLPEDEKKNVREVIEDKIGISFDSLYPYDVQHHADYIIHQILAGHEETFRKYYGNLDKTAQNFIDRFVKDRGRDTLVCYSCNKPYIDAEIENCPDCGDILMRGHPTSGIEIKEDEIELAIAEKLRNLNDDVQASDGTRLLQTSFEAEEISGNNFIKSTFHLVEAARTAMDSHWHEFYTYCVGNGNVPQRVNEYLLDCVLVTYGQSQTRDRDDYGTINLYEFLEGENPGQQFANAVRESQSSLRNRVREQAMEARERLTELQQKVDNGIIADASRDERIELKAEYDYDEFERDVFYLFKSMFLLTERWGREGKKETDGCLILPREHGYFVASYDPKLTYDVDGYDLGTDEKNKAAYYILSESNQSYISNTLKDGGTLDCHIFISDIFRKGQFSSVTSSVQEWFSLTDSDSQGIDVPLAFLTVDNLLELYDIFDTNYSYIIEYPKVQKAFREEIQRQLRPPDDYCVIDEESLEIVKEKVLEARSTVRKKKATKRYSG